jgi:hypothetical protein
MPIFVKAIQLNSNHRNQMIVNDISDWLKNNKLSKLSIQLYHRDNQCFNIESDRLYKRINHATYCH